MSEETVESLKSKVLDLIKTKLAQSEDLHDLRSEVDGIQRDQAFIEQILLDLQRSLEKTEDLTFESLRKMEEEIMGISKSRRESDSILTSMESKIDLLLKQQNTPQVESLFSHEPPQEDRDDDRSELGSGSFGTVFRMRFKHDNKLYAVKEIQESTRCRYRSKQGHECSA